MNDIFEGPFHDLHYNSVYDSADASSYYLFSPESIVRICAQSMEDKIEELYIRKQYDDAL